MYTHSIDFKLKLSNISTRYDFMSKIVKESLTLFNYHSVLNGQHFRLEKPKISEKYKNSHGFNEDKNY